MGRTGKIKNLLSDVKWIWTWDKVREIIYKFESFIVHILKWPVKVGTVLIFENSLLTVSTSIENIYVMYVHFLMSQLSGVNILGRNMQINLSER